LIPAGPPQTLARAGLTLALAASGLLGCHGQRRPNFLIVVLDTVRRDAAGWPTAATPAELARARLTPSLAALAGRGVAWSQAWSVAPWTVPSHASLFTGLLPSQHGCDGENLRLRTGLPTLAERLGGAGYRTAAFYSNPWLADRATGILRDFQEKLESSIGGLGRMTTGDAGNDQGGAASAANFRDWLQSRDPARPFLAFINILEAHLPYAPTAADLAVAAPGVASDGGVSIAWAHEYNAGLHPDSLVDWRHVRSCYAGDVVAADRLLGQILATLREAGLENDTVVIVTSDHGENLGDHGLFEHQFSVHETLLGVPLVIAGPGIGPAGSTRSAPVLLTDLFATVIELAGLTPDRIPPGSRPLLSGNSAVDRPLIGEYAGPPAGLLALLRTLNARLDTARLAPARRTIRIGDLRLTLASDGTLSLNDTATDPAQEIGRASCRERV